MCARCEELEEEVAFLKSELGLRSSADELRRLKAAFDLTPQEARIVLAMARAKGKPVMRVQLEELINERSHKDECAYNLPSVYVAKIRRKLGKEAVITAWGSGYSLSPEALERVRAVLETARAA